MVLPVSQKVTAITLEETELAAVWVFVVLQQLKPTLSTLSLS
jgi:hypothetical protein